MGADARVFLLDFDAYKQEILPLFYEFLLTGQTPEWLQPLIEHLNVQTNNWRPVDLRRHCTYLEADLSWSGPYDDTNLFSVDWDQRSCKSTECPERGPCPFHHDNQSGLAESLNRILEIAISIRCLGTSQFIGRSRYVTDYWPMLADWGVRRNDSLFKLLAQLGKRGFVVGYQWVSSNDGINGWLDPQATLELARRLHELPLPRYEASFEAMEEFRQPHPVLYEKFGITSYECSGFSIEALTLSFIRTVAEIAAKERKGILWGNDVLPATSYLELYFHHADT